MTKPQVLLPPQVIPAIGSAAEAAEMTEHSEERGLGCSTGNGRPIGTSLQYKNEASPWTCLGNGLFTV